MGQVVFPVCHYDHYPFTRFKDLRGKSVLRVVYDMKLKGIRFCKATEKDKEKSRRTIHRQSDSDRGGGSKRARGRADEQTMIRVEGCGQ